MTLTNERIIALYKGRQIMHGNLWSDVRALADSLPDKPYVFNLCENRYLFCLMLLAAASRGQISLLPPASGMTVISEIACDYPGAYFASDNSPEFSEMAWFKVEAPGSKNFAPETALDWQRTALIVFTSGTTGKPKPSAHTLSTFRISAKMAVASLGLADRQLLMVSTTPPQHMYGLETSVFWPLFSSLVLHDGRPFFPADISQVLETAPWPCVLATTPAHLRVLTRTTASWSKLACIVSATDTLSEKLARETRKALGQSPCEIYGSTETLSFATREVLQESLWQPYAGCRLVQDDVGFSTLESLHLPSAVLLHDSFTVETDGRFTVLGRHGDMIKIAGKRSSLAELNKRLKDIEGVEDGVFFAQETPSTEPRLAALVVGKLDKHDILTGLQAFIDEVFLPRKIYFVDAIARNDSGKLTKTALEKLLAGLDSK
jgi:acyl-coenzyme A synthetase/AMP-(fatty) acid ligase